MKKKTMALRKMQQVELPFDSQFTPGWTGERYLRCNDRQWHLVLAVYDGGVVDTQCGADASLAESVTTERLDKFPMCETCVMIQGNKKRKRQ